MPIVLALRRHRQEDQKPKVILVYIVSLRTVKDNEVLALKNK